MMMKIYAGSLPKALRAIYPTHTWVEWKFMHVTKGFWQNKANRKLYFDEIGKELGVKELADWYTFQTEDLSKFGGLSQWSSFIHHYFTIHQQLTSFVRAGNGLLSNFYGDSLPAALSDVYPDHEWQPWRFSVAPSSYWRTIAGSNDPEKIRGFVEELGKQLGVASLEQWYRVSPAQVRASGGSFGLKSIGGLRKALRVAYPGHEWEWSSTLKSQTPSDAKTISI
jgi:hypothetical protein